MSTQSASHMGTKFMGFFFGLILAIIYTVLQFFTHPTLLVTDLYNIALVDAFFILIFPLIVFLAELLWRFAHKYSEKFPA